MHVRVQLPVLHIANAVRRRVKRMKGQADADSDTAVTSRVFVAVVTALKPAPTGPGEMGKPVRIDKEKEAEMKEKFKINQFNLMASDMIALNRSLPDVRMTE